MGSGGSSPDPIAERPERVVDVEPEEIELGTSEETLGTNLRTQGKRALTKPTGGAAPVAGIAV